MDDDDLSMDSFVDIVANTVGMVVILTMLTVARVDKRGLEVNIELKNQLARLEVRMTENQGLADTIMDTSGKLILAGAETGFEEMDLSKLKGASALDKTNVLLKRMDQINVRSKQLEEELSLMSARRDDAKTKHSMISQGLTSLRTRKRTLTTAMRTRKTVEAQLVTDLPGLNMGTFERTPLTSMKQEVKQLDVKIKTMAEEAKIGREDFNRLKKEVEDLKAEKATADEELARYREVTGLEIAVVAPPPLREQVRMPVFFECYSRASATGGPDELRVRFVRPGAAPDGEHYRSIVDAASAFHTFLAGQTDEFKSSHRLHFIVRPDAGAAFRKARGVARATGWTVGWNPIAKDVKLKIGAVPSPTTTAYAGSLSATPR